MSGFNASARRDDVSLKLRSQNMRNTREQTKKLEDESRKMEERLRELKTAMSMEKEERERQGGGFWGKGQTHVGSLTSYASEVLQAKPEKVPKEGKKKKIKILQDEPIELPKRSGQPGTVKYIAQRKLPSGSTPRDKQKGAKCGQCEERSATLSCVQCSEIYCAGCFAAFHLKGALKQHRSCPISAAGSRVCMSPRHSVDASPRGSHPASGSVMTPVKPTYSIDGSEASGPHSSYNTPRQAVGASLLQGDYDESESASSFQQALKAWRQGDEVISPSPPTSNRQPKPPKPVASPVKSPVVSMDCGTGTIEESKVVDIKFTGSLSYVEKLMLKKHRRTEVSEQSTPRLSDQSRSSSRLSNQSTKLSYQRERTSARGTAHSPVPRKSYDRGDYTSYKNGENLRERSFIDDGERVDFQSLYEAVACSEGSNIHTPCSDFSMVETLNSPNPTRMSVSKPMSTTSDVTEVSPHDSWLIEERNKREPVAKFIVKEPEKEPRSNNISPDEFPSTQPGQKYNIQEMFPTNHYMDKENTFDNTTLTPDITSGRKSVKEKRKSSFEKRTNISPEASFMENGTMFHKESSPIKHSKLKSARPKSSASRPASRAQSRAQSRAASRMKMIDGLLTKTPSQALHEVARLGDNTDMSSFTYQSPLEGFFLAGVDLSGLSEQANEERTITPRKYVAGSSSPNNKSQRPKSRMELKSARGEREAIKVSNRLYQMAPRSWKPDASVGETIPLGDVHVDGEIDTSLILSYTYSGQMDGQATEWRPYSSQSSIAQNPSDDLGLVSSYEDSNACFGSTLNGLDNNQRELNPQPYHNEPSLPSTPSLPQPTANNPRTKSANRRVVSDSRSVTPVTPVLPDSKQKSSKDTLHFTKSSLPSSGDNLQGSSNQSTDLSHNLGTASSRNKTPHLKGSLLPSKSEIPFTRSKSKINAKSDSLSRSNTQTSEVMNKGIRVASRESYKKSSSGLGMSQRHSNTNQPQQSRPSSSTSVSDKGLVRRASYGSKDQRPNSCTGVNDRSSSGVKATSQSFDKGAAQDSIITDMMSTRVHEDNWMQGEEDFDDDDNYNDNQMSKKESDPSRWETEVRPFTRDSLSSARSQTGRKNEKEMSTRPSSTMSRPESRAIEMEGEDLSVYDTVLDPEERNEDDKHALEELEWELASNTGRITADGNISRLSNVEPEENDGYGSSSSRSSSSKSLRFTANDDYDLNSKLLEDERIAEQDFNNINFEYTMNMDEDEVKALR